MTTYGDALYQLGGAPVGARIPLGLWADTYYVDGDSGSDGNTGRAPDRAFASVTQALSAASAQSVIYVRGLGPLHTTDATDPERYTENATVAFAKYGIAIVGTGANTVNPFYVQMRGLSTGPILTINAPGTVVENICFNRGSSTTGSIRIQGDESASECAWNVLIANCQVRNANSMANAGIIADAGSYNTFLNVTFDACAVGMHIASGSKMPVRSTRVEGCHFLAQNSSTGITGPYLRIAGACYETVVHSCTFAGDCATNELLYAHGYGIVSNCYFASNGITPAPAGADIDVTATVIVSGCFDDTGAVIAT